jgi:hypothetical protein
MRPWRIPAATYRAPGTATVCDIVIGMADGLTVSFALSPCTLFA